MRENRPSGSEGGAGANPLFLPLSSDRRADGLAAVATSCLRK